MMCGIAGFFNFKNSEKLVRAVNQIQRHRGPDYQGEWISDQASFAHQRLSIIDLSELSNQPFEKSGTVIVFNGEIYNYQEIKKELESRNGVTFKTTGDTEVVLESFRAWGETCLQRFIGMFSFCIYDVETKTAFIARDHFGIKPLYYHYSNHQFAFASELKAILAVESISKEIDKFALLSSLNYLWPSSSRSMFKGVGKLPPGHFIRLKADRLDSYELKRYWSVEPNLKIRSEQEWIELVDEAMVSSVKRHMVADVPVSCFLSGGLDSSLISVLAKKDVQELSTFTIGSREEDKRIEKMPEDETYALKLAQQFSFKHRTIVIQPTIIDELPKMVNTLDEPIGDPAAINTLLICQEARKLGVKVLLSGMGADELFLGYRRQKATLLAARYQHLPTWLRMGIKSSTDLMPVRLGSRGIKITRWMKRFLSFANLPIEKAYRRSYSYYDDSDYTHLLRDDYKNEVRLLNKEHEEYFNAHPELDLENKMCFTDIHMFMLGLNLTYTDRASMAASVEVRVPFIDRDVVELAMSIPGNFKYKNGISKYILKRAAEKHLPREIIYRPKASFSAPIRAWISNDLKPLIDDVLSEESIRRRGIFNPAYVKQLIEADRKGYRDNAYQIYQLLTTELWFRNHRI
jgi:asparagine synthase (glutamine-hydrolysing)